MKFGIALPNYGRSTTYEAVRRTAIAADQLGYASVWTTDHLLVPKENIDPYGTMYESLVTLALIAENTRVQLGTSVLVLPMRNPVLMAKQIVTIDAATQGRMIVGVAVGWNEQEFKHLNADFKTRGKRLDEDIQLMRAVWSNDQVTFHGKYSEIELGISLPRPAKGNIPIWIGGNGEPSLRRAARLGDGWQATGASPEQIAEGVKRIRELAPSKAFTVSVRVSVDFNPATSPTFKYLGNTRYRLAGSTDAIRARLREYEQAGLEHAVLVFPADDVSTGIGQMERFARDLMPEFK
jgi:probable F420-dependent oxidoreductase